jgi:hypothetical protein
VQVKDKGSPDERRVLQLQEVKTQGDKKPLPHNMFHLPAREFELALHVHSLPKSGPDGWRDLKEHLRTWVEEGHLAGVVSAEHVVVRLGPARGTDGQRSVWELPDIVQYCVDRKLQLFSRHNIVEVNKGEMAKCKKTQDAGEEQDREGRAEQGAEGDAEAGAGEDELEDEDVWLDGV